MTFEPHPRHYFKPDTLPFRLTPFRAKVTQIDALGVDAMLVVAFNRLFSQITADEFVDDVLVAGLGAKNVVVGYDFTFGRDRGGDTEFLAAKAPAKNFEFTTVQPVATADAVIYSSTVIRNYLTGGKPGHAAALLGRPFEIEGRVVKGDQIGRTIGFRTANLVLGDYIIRRLEYTRYASGSMLVAKSNGTTRPPISARGPLSAAHARCWSRISSTLAAISTDNAFASRLSNTFDPKFTSTP